SRNGRNRRRGGRWCPSGEDRRRRAGSRRQTMAGRSRRQAPQASERAPGPASPHCRRRRVRAATRTPKPERADTSPSALTLSVPGNPPSIERGGRLKKHGEDESRSARAERQRGEGDQPVGQENGQAEGGDRRRGRGRHEGQQL